MKHIPVLHDLAGSIKPENIDTRPVAISGPMLVTMQDDVMALREHPSKLNTLGRILQRHPIEIRNERVLAISDDRVVLRVRLPDIPLHRFGWPSLIKHQVVKLGHIALVLFDRFAALHFDSIA